MKDLSMVAAACFLVSCGHLGVASFLILIYFLA